ncbi:hypothetical protein SPI_03960 [Niveomyces insectorum RCEF 264]|uniref:Uncharacterized protein n=1 Tax=Niveomyces insectorum RCEF 264 TaxID=1081102 RepID=A0A167VB28_9HYPO|nr:hypothetical protein SPI_03960 [Niveomyces insectorum RCEF 264]
MAFDGMDTEASMDDIASVDASDTGTTGIDIDTDGARRTTASAVRPRSSSSGGGDAFRRSRRQPPKRRMSVYDAVAGRLHLADNSTPTAATTALRDTALAPDEALFRSVHAPPRFEETDTYFAHADLDARGGVLPDSDLLVAVHQYASAFYEAGRFTERPGERRRRRRKRRRQDGGKPASHTTKTHPGRLLDERSLDETALLALGILLEEAGRAALGRDGDLVFTEGAEEEGTASWETSSDEDDEAVAAAAAGDEGGVEEDSHEEQAADGADEEDATAG